MSDLILLEEAQEIEFLTRINLYEIFAKDHLINSVETYSQADQKITEGEHIKKGVKEKLDPIVSKRHKSHKEATKFRAKMIDPVENSSQILMTKMKVYQKAQDEKAAEEKRKLEAEAKEKQDSECLKQAGEMEKAIAAVDEAVRLNSDMPMALVMKASVYAMAGQDEKATVMLEDLLELTQARYTCPYEVATVFLALGRREEAFKFLHMAYEFQSECMPFLGSDMRMDELRGSQEFQDIMTDVGVLYRGPEPAADGR